jgi:hypothetical protein
MKAIWLITFFLFILLSACNQNNNTPAVNIIPNGLDSIAAPMLVNGCYQYKSERLTVSLQGKTTGDTVTGSLRYDYAEKDDNTGTIKGTFSGDTLFADYTFKAEGFETVREVAFLRRGDKLKEGYGDVEDKNGKIVFKDRNFLIFPGRVTLVKTACEKL